MLNSILLFIEEGKEVINEGIAAGNEVLNDVAAETAQKPQGGSPWTMIIMMLLIFAVFYFFMIRPQRKQQKELQKKREAMKKGDKVVTAGGIFGEIKEVQDTTFIITIAKDVTIKVNKESVYADLTDASQAAATEKK